MGNNMESPTIDHNKAVSANYVYVMADLVERHGGTRQSLIKHAGLTRHQSQNNDAYSFITLQQYKALLREALVATNNPALGLYLGSSIKFSDHGTFAFSALSFPTLWDAMKVGMKFSKLVNRIVDLKMEEQKEFNIIRIDTAHFSGALYQTLIEMVMSLFCEIFKFMLHDDISSIELHFSYGEPPHAQQYYEVFEPSVTFEAIANEVRIPKKLADKPQMMANPDIAKQFERECDDLISKMYEPKSYPQQVQEALLLSRGGFPLLEDIAHQASMSPRTLRRRLQEAGTSYKKILDDVRLQLAHRYLCTTTLSIGEIAELLGYTDQNSFSHAFKQLSGSPPSAYRKQNSAIQS